MAKEELKHDGLFERLTDLVLYDDVHRWVGLLIVMGVGAVVGTVTGLSNDGPQSDVAVDMGISILMTAIILLGLYSLGIEKRQKRISLVLLIQRWHVLDLSESCRPSVSWAVDMGIDVLMTAIILLDFCSRVIKKLQRRITPYRLLASAGALCSIAIIFGVLSYRYETRTLTKDFGRAIEAHDYNRVASITEQAATVSERLHAELTQKFVQTLAQDAAELPKNPDTKQPNEKKVKALASALTEVAKRNPEHPEAWRAIATLASYSTSEIGATAQLPDCDITQAPHIIDPSELPFSVGITSPTTGYVFKNCTLHMDHLPPGKLETGTAYFQADPKEKLTPWISGSLALIFNCNVTLTDSGIAQTGILEFKAFNSRFEFRIEKTPSAPVQNLLLASLEAPVPGEFSLQLPRAE